MPSCKKLSISPSISPKATHFYPFHRIGVALSLSALTLGFVIAPKIIPGLTPPALAQAILDEEVTNYAKAVSEIEPLRLTAYETANDILVAAGIESGILETPLKCTATDLSDMPDVPRPKRVDLRTTLVNFCNEASQIAEAHDLTPLRFNSITAAHQEDADLAARIQKAVSDL